MPSDGDIIVPSHTVAVIGTTSINVTDPEHLQIQPWEVQKMLSEGNVIVPGFKDMRVLRAWAGVRPLFQDHYEGSAGRDVTRKLALLDHREREGVSCFLTITGGKWTTFRLMAEATIDLACEHLGVERVCLTKTTPVAGAEQGNYWLGHRLREIEDDHLQGNLICECELVTRTMVENAVRNNPTLTLDDLRRDVRLGKGPCQGGFCTYRAVGILDEMRQRGTWKGAMGDDPATAGRWHAAYLQSPAHNEREVVTVSPVPEADTPPFFPNLLLRDFVQERWKGVTPILWGRQMKQERLDELIYLSLMNVDHLPGKEEESPVTEFYHFDVTPRGEEDAEVSNA
jgi:glycerol-3-phosphate dehydrogenase